MIISVREMTLVALFAALTAVCSQISFPIPFSPVPFSLQLVAICLAGGILGKKLGTLSIVVYLLLGAIGLPVFAQFQGGAAMLVGPTGGFLLAFPIATYIIGLMTEKKITYFNANVSMLIALVIIYGVGLIHFKFVTSMSWQQSFLVAIAQFIIPDLIKIFITSAVVIKVRSALSTSNFKLHPTD